MARSLKTKDPQKPPKWFKKMKGGIRRAKVKQALRAEKLPERMRKTNTWDWN